MKYFSQSTADIPPVKPNYLIINLGTLIIAPALAASALQVLLGIQYKLAPLSPRCDTHVAGCTVVIGVFSATRTGSHGSSKIRGQLGCICTGAESCLGTGVLCATAGVYGIAGASTRLVVCPFGVPFVRVPALLRGLWFAWPITSALDVPSVLVSVVST